MRDLNEPKSESQTVGKSETLLSLKDLAKNHDQIQRPVPEGCTYKWQHNVAAFLHGWTLYEYHVGPIEMSDRDYIEALTQAAKGDTHPPAIRKV